MSYIRSEGNLTGLPELKVSKRGNDYATVTVACNFRSADVDGTWHTVGTRFYDLTVMGKDAIQLTQIAADAGNIRVVFGGDLVVREYDRKDGTTGRANEVMVDFIAPSLFGQDVAVTRRQREASA